MIRVLVAEDSITTRELLIEILGADPDLVVVGEAKNGLEAVELTRRLRPDVVTMDIRMPKMDGFEATKQIMTEVPTPIVIVSGSFDADDVNGSMHALRAGALSVLQKPVGPASSDFEEASRQLVATVKAMSQVKLVRHWPQQHPPAPPTGSLVRTSTTRCRIVAVAASTGGPAALQNLISALDGSFPVPIVVVQHIADGFVEGLATWLNSTSLLKVRVAAAGEPLRPETVYLAPDHRHLGITKEQTVVLANVEPIQGFKPSASFLYESVADVYGPSAVAVILTGMGQDGVTGLRAIRQAGGYVIAQDEASSVVFGMPGAAVAQGLADAVLPLTSIAATVSGLVQNGRI